MRTRKNSTTKKLSINKETVTVLNSMHLNNLIGGIGNPTHPLTIPSACFGLYKAEALPITTC